MADKKITDYPAAEIQNALHEQSSSLHNAINQAKGHSNNMTEAGMGLVGKLNAQQDEIKSLRDELLRNKVAEAVVWRVLALDVFGCWHWAGGASQATKALEQALKPENGPAPITEEIVHDFRLWGAKTTKIILRNSSTHADVVEYLKNGRSDFIRIISENLGLGPNPSGNFALQLGEIFERAITLDKIFGQAAANWNWRYTALSGPGANPGLDDDIMQVHEGDSDPKFGKRTVSDIVQMFIAPALVRRGEVAGERMLQTVATKMLVTCQKL